jgi:hypothetical protein
MKSLVDYWIVYRERFDTLGSISDKYYRVALSECISAISRMWRWYSGCNKEEQRRAAKTLEEMQRFLEEHRKEVLSGAYSKHVKATCYYARTKNPLVFKSLYSFNSLYRSRNRNRYFEQ